MTSVNPIIAQATEFIKGGELVAFPTETVYGLGADASNPAALKKLYEAKGRPTSHPVIVHVGSIEKIAEWAEEVPQVVFDLAEKFCPGPLTFILPKQSHVLSQVTGGQDSVGIRIPNHPLALELLKSFNGGIVAPSANKFGRLSPTCAKDVIEAFGQEVALVLDGGSCQVGIESTIVDVRGSEIVVLRPGMITAEQIETVVGRKVNNGFARVNTLSASEDGVKVTRVPGALQSHYAPSTPLNLVASEGLYSEVSGRLGEGKRVAVLSRIEQPPEFANQIASSQLVWKVSSGSASDFARGLYADLHELDALQCSVILVESPPDGSDWVGISDRLNRASQL